MPPSPIKEMPELIDRWLIWLGISKGRADRTVKKYRQCLRDWHLHCLNNEINGLSPLAVQLDEYTGLYLHQKGLGPSARRPVISAIKNFYSWMFRSGHAERDYSGLLEHPKVPANIPTAASLKTAEALLTAPDLSTFKGRRDAAMFALLMGTGIRVSALVAMNTSSLIWEDVEGQQRLHIRVREKGNKEVFKSVPQAAATLVRAYVIELDRSHIDPRLPNGDKVLWVSTSSPKHKKHNFYGEARRINRRSVTSLMWYYAKKERLDIKQCHPHALRHLYGTQMKESGVSDIDLAHLMGHSSVNTTKIYTSMAKNRASRINDESNPLAKMGSRFVRELSELQIPKESF